MTCGCSTYVQATNTAALKQMSQLQQDWNALGCAKSWGCPGTPCPAVNGATCSPDTGGSGTCMDLSTSPP